MTTDLHQELLDRAAVLVDLSSSQVDAWVSGLFSIWDAAEEAIAFVAACEEDRSVVAQLVLRGIEVLADDEVATAARDALDRLSLSAPGLAEVGEAECLQAWSVTGVGGRAMVFAAGIAEADHAVLVELDADGTIADLHLADDASSWLPATESPMRRNKTDQAGGREEPEAADGDETQDRSLAEGWVIDDEIRVTEVALPLALATVAEAWQRSSSEDAARTSSLIANQHVVRRRLHQSGIVGLRSLGTGGRVDLGQLRGMTVEEVESANAAARSLLSQTLRLSENDQLSTDQGWIDLVLVAIPGLSRQQQAGLAFLEWADWLGVALGLYRAGAGTRVTGAAFVDLVNRCPEVSSTIGRQDREYVEWAFDLAIEHLEDAGLVSAQALTELGHATVVGSFLEAWANDPPD